MLGITFVLNAEALCKYFHREVHKRKTFLDLVHEVCEDGLNELFPFKRSRWNTKRKRNTCQEDRRSYLKDGANAVVDKVAVRRPDFFARAIRDVLDDKSLRRSSDDTDCCSSSGMSLDESFNQASGDRPSVPLVNEDFLATIPEAVLKSILTQSFCDEQLNSMEAQLASLKDSYVRYDNDMRSVVHRLQGSATSLGLLRLEHELSKFKLCPSAHNLALIDQTYSDTKDHLLRGRFNSEQQSAN
ncbi:hypothetical protein AB1Y20_012612 [Prymnesium parvum]|uniref:HPt domain-containing protein n=1 Tax=Prymnesium parvum TaxID=97485 RepID=A0AB34IJ64_PRYPA